MHYLDFAICWIYEHETLTAGFLGVIAASASVYMLNKQIKYQIVKDESDRNARRTAIRSFGPTLLDKLNQYGLECFEHIVKLYDEAPEDIAVTVSEKPKILTLYQSKKPPLLERQTLEDLKGWIEVEESENQKKLIILLENYQLIHSRFPTINDVSSHRSTLRLALLSSAVFALVVEECWQFARQIRTSNGYLLPLDDRIDRLFKSIGVNNNPFKADINAHDELKNHIMIEYNGYMEYHR